MELVIIALDLFVNLNLWLFLILPVSKVVLVVLHAIVQVHDHYDNVQVNYYSHGSNYVDRSCLILCLGIHLSFNTSINNQ